MKRPACLVALALVLPCAASDPTAPRMEKRKPTRDLDTMTLVALPPRPPRLLDDRLVRAVLLPVGSYAQQVAARVYYHRLMLENGGQGRPRGPYWPFLD